MFAPETGGCKSVTRTPGGAENDGSETREQLRWSTLQLKDYLLFSGKKCSEQFETNCEAVSGYSTTHVSNITANAANKKTLELVYRFQKQLTCLAAAPALHVLIILSSTASSEITVVLLFIYLFITFIEPGNTEITVSTEAYV